jgi:hypothetical protein
MPTPKFKPLNFNLLWLQKGQMKTALFAAFEKSPSEENDGAFMSDPALRDREGISI